MEHLGKLAALWPILLIVAVAVIFIRLGRAPKPHDKGNIRGGGPGDGGMHD